LNLTEEVGQIKLNEFSHLRLAALAFPEGCDRVNRIHLGAGSGIFGQS
jgi:hypothetical protein